MKSGSQSHIQKGPVLPNVVTSLVEREYFPGNYYRKNQRILRTIISKGRTEYRKLWEKHSNKPIYSDGRNIFFDNYRQHYSGNSLSCCPKKQYHLPSTPAQSKIEDALVCYSNQDSINICDNKDSLIAVTANSHLQVYNLHNGEMIHDHLLLSPQKFRNIAWSTDQETFVIRSCHSRISSLARQAGFNVHILMVLAMFNVLPLQFVGMIEIDKRVWGRDVTNAMISGGLLILMYQYGIVKMFNFQDIIEKYRSSGEDDVRMTPSLENLHVNIKVTEKPPILFEVKCEDHDVQLGGFPWVYLITPYGSRGCFSVFSLDDRQVIKNGKLDYENRRIEINRALFHGDESGRIIHKSDDTVQIFEISKNSTTIELEKIIEIVVQDDDQKDRSLKGSPQFTSSGRLIKKRYHQDAITDNYFTVTIHGIDYENELDVLCISSTSENPDSTQGYLDLYENSSDHLLRRIPIQEKFNEFYEHRVFMDKDTVVHIVKGTQSKFVCTVYKLFGLAGDEIT